MLGRRSCDDYCQKLGKGRRDIIAENGGGQGEDEETEAVVRTEPAGGLLLVCSQRASLIGETE